MTVGFCDQFKTLLWRNLLLKKKMKSKTFTEFATPIMMALCIVTFRIGHATYKGEVYPFGNASLEHGLSYYSLNNFGVAPYNNNTKKVMDSVVKELPLYLPVKILWFENETELEEEFNRNSSAFAVGIVFTENPEKNFSYKLRFPSNKLPRASDKYGSPENCRNLHHGFFLVPVSSCPALSYYSSGFIVLQSIIDKILIKMLPCSGRPPVIEEDQIKALLDENPHYTTREIADIVKSSNSTVFQHLKKLRYMNRYDIWIPYDLMEKNLLDRISICDSLERRNENEPFLKHLVTEYYFKHVINIMNNYLFQKLLSHESKTETIIQLYPKEKFVSESTTVKAVIPLYLMLAFSPLVSILALIIVTEKEKKIKEGMLMMGMNITCYWLAWFVTEAIMAFIISILITVIIFGFNILPYTSVFIIFGLLMLFSLSIVMIAFMLTPFFNNAKVAGAALGSVYLLFGLFYFLAIWVENKVNVIFFFLLALLSPTAFSLGFLKVITYDVSGQVSWEQMSLGKFSINDSFIMLSVDIVLYGLLAYYFDCVIPGTYGRKQKPWFFLLPSYWQPKSFDSETLYVPPDIKVDAINSEDIEPVPLELYGKERIRISNITKIFNGSDGKPVKAVKDLTFSIFEGQITALLGHNGAGKTTLLNMLNGMFSPTSGTASICGLNLNNMNNLIKIRSMTGVCLQENILLDDLNAEEHLTTFACLKGVVQKDVETMLCDIDLFESKHVPAKNLSGGQKRKLCVGIALIGNPKIVYLDEPTSGIDPYSRRLLWTFLQKEKKNRAIVLTTHSMDEADILADRKAIISKGKLKCAGSSLYLKNKFGIGYHLTFTLNPSSYDEASIERLVKNIINNTQLSRKTNLELSYLLPLDETEKFPQLFASIENVILTNQYGIVNYGISMTTLEEVFLNLASKEVDDDNDNTLIEDTPNNSSDSMLKSLIDTKPNPSSFQAFFALLKIRIILFFREIVAASIIFLMPVILIVVSYVIMRNTAVSVPEPLNLTASLYNSTFLYQNETGKLLNSMNRGLVEQNLNVRLLHENPNITNLATSCMAIVVKNFLPEIKWNYLINDTCIHSLPILQNIISNMMIKYYGLSKSISVISHPFLNDDVQIDNQSLFWVYVIGICMIILPPLIAVEVVEDRENKVKNQLEVSGLKFFTYWGCVLLSHIMLFLLSMLIFVISLAIMKLEFLQSADFIFAFTLLFMFFIPTSLLFCYNLCYMFDRQETAKGVLSLFCFLPATVMLIPIIILEATKNSLAVTLHYIFSFVTPFYSLLGGLYYLMVASIEQKVMALRMQNEDKVSSVFSWKYNVSVLYLVMAIQFILYFLLLKVVDNIKAGRNISHMFSFSRKKSENIKSNSDFPKEEDDDVKNERERVQNIIDTKDFAIVIKQLRKVYTKRISLKDTLSKVAVRNLNLGVDTGSIFGLLGPNGAGKTTVIKMITAEVMPTYGEISLAGYDITYELSKALQEIGYCPQHDALWNKLTVEEHLHLYAAIRGISRSQIPSICKKLLNLLHIEKFAKNKIRTLSGGTKRKVCFIISILGRPTAVLLDEPSTGLDPQAKRYLWEIIQTMFPPNGNRSILFTTHSMEEADTLCTEVGIMVKGTLRCLGSIQHLKNKYGIGYTLDIKIKKNEDGSYVNKDNVKEFIQKNFPLCIIKEEFCERLTYCIPQCNSSLANIFGCLEKAKAFFEEYNFSQTTLEQVFLEFAKEQEVEKDE
ncbi:cholesterol transporter ABCA5-like [Centruroides vittatus]|uniref:cholesterol transporter ABCA5-like n=1 Tax=Centruroides vittatus TaxID=120091 RepID=UPI00350EC182